MHEDESQGSLCYISPAIPADEKNRLQAVIDLGLMDTVPEERFDRIVRLSRTLFSVPISYVSLIGHDRQYFKARSGIDMVGTTREVSMCGHAILQDLPLIVPDARKDHRFANNPLVIGEPFVRFYASHPLRGPNGYKVGTLCVIDRSPRTFSDREIELLKELTTLVEHELELTKVINAQADAIKVKEALEASERQLAVTVDQLQSAKHQTEELLYSILPRELANELHSKGRVAPVRYEDVSVFFADFAGFTKVASTMAPGELVEELNECFCHFDWVMAKHGVEKLKTIGDGYLAVSGIQKQQADNPLQLLKAAFEIRDYMAERRLEREKKGLPAWGVRIGLHVGPLIAGVVGVQKIAFDVWGDTVNTASRIESAGEPGRINVSSVFYDRVRDEVIAVSRGPIDCKNKGPVEMFFIEKLK